MLPGKNSQVVGMCATATTAADEPRALCIIRDLSNGQLNNNKSVINLPASTTASQLMQEVGKKFQYEPDSFELVLQRICDKETIHIHEHTEETLEELGFRCGDNERNNLIIGNKNASVPKKTSTTEVEQSFSYTDNSAMDTNVTLSTQPSFPIRDLYKNYTYSNAVASKQDTGYVGLVNQAMTCYLNSLLQTLFMTPEFRNALYRWEFDGTEEDGTKSIPYQLQRLFLLLQTSNKPAVGTTELTTSFGWDSSEAWQQHDVQELCRVMFDALEQKFKNTEQADLISRLYEGKLKDYVKCLECGYESAREDTFLDVPLVVRPFGSSQAYASVGEALRAFVTPEILQGSNQYFCEHCNKKCDAHKGLKFIKFPYLLTLQLKRFDFDPVTMHRIKLNDRVAFPEILTVNEFIKVENKEASDDGDTTDSGSVLDDENAGFPNRHTMSPETLSDNELQDDDEGIDVGPSIENSHEVCINEKNLKKSMEKGPYVYELFSIMVHSGSANGGHYYAYIKDFKHGEWYCFNDAQVTKITYDDIQKTYGGGPLRGYYSSAYSSSTNAYMLMYRQIDKEKNAECMSLVEFPEHVQALLQCMQEQEERERRQRELDRSMCKIKLFCQYPREMIEMKLKVHKDCTLAEATATAHTIMGLEGNVPLDCCRLVKYDDFHDSLECSFDNCNDMAMGDLLGGVKSNYKFELFLEIKKPNEIFQEYRPGGTTVKVHTVDLEKEEIAIHPVTIRSHPTNTVQDLKLQIAKALDVNCEMRLVLELYANDYKLLDVPTKTLSSEGLRKSNKVFAEFKDAADAEKPYNESKLFKVLDSHGHTICIQVTLPKIDQGTVDRLKLYEDYSDDEGKYDLSSEEDTGENAQETAGIRKTFLRKDVYFQRPSKSQATSKSDVSGCSIDFTKGEPIQVHDEAEESAESKKTLVISQSLKAPIISKSNVSGYSFDFTKMSDPFQDCDEGLGDSETGDSTSCQSNPAFHSDQSEDSSLTDSERTLVGDEMSPRNNSPDIPSAEMEQDLEPPEISKPECDSILSNSDSGCRLYSSQEEGGSRNMSSPEENTIEDCRCRNAESSNSDVKHCFRAYPHTDYETGEKMLRVYADKRITLFKMKKELEKFIGLKSNCFRIYKVNSNNQEYELTRLSDDLMTFGEDSKLAVKLGRALRKGEYKVKIYQLCLNETEPIKFLSDCVLTKGMTVLTAKKEILAELKEKCSMDIPLNRCRLRKKSWKSPGAIYLDHLQFEKDIPIDQNSEMFVEFLPDAEPVTSTTQLVLFTRRWHPAAFKLDSFKEIVFDDTKTLTITKKLSEISEIPEDSIEFAKGQGTFPCENSLLSIHDELEWLTASDNPWRFFNGDDGQVIYYRDKREELRKLTEEEKREITNKENAKSNKVLKNVYSPRKERALKIYTVDTTPTSQNQSSEKSLSAHQVVPDLD
ncbi:ubiquitin carboxyl-terminal hydrolase 47 isoform X2 [Parasteatoda tepidariorum]|uniref:ubiquitin carboxyl-terminal hydrolase 47 isoform X2 n=1 Tax=Parasteatoda tepidariorum TaxID=114398 RepID=UPI000A2C0D22|nr:ubiquitin carboxyl-terminal hydrolase 47 isoform X2 [Parasteatoda tepidariorum]